MRSTGLFIALFVIGCEMPSPLPGRDAEADAPTVLDAGRTPALAFSTCARVTEGDESGAECAWLEVPLDHASTEGPTLSLFVKRITADPTMPHRGALVLSNGGLVSSGVDLEPSIDFWLAKAPGYDLYIPDHRGTGRSGRLGCASAEDPASEGGWAITDGELPACIAALEATHGDTLPLFSAEQAAHDIATLVEAIREIESGRVMLYGISYGSFLVQRYLHVEPDGVDGVVLDGLCNPGTCTMSEYDGWTGELAERFFGECARDPFCSDRLGPDPAARAREVLDSLDEGHCPEAVAAGLERDTVRAVISGILSYLGWSLRPVAAALVHRLGRCDAGDVRALSQFARTYLALPPTAPVSERLASRFTGFEVAFRALWQTPPPTIEALATQHESALASLGTSLSLGRIRETYPVRDIDPSASTFPVTGVPMLLLHGTLDLIPDRSADAAREAYTAPHQTYVSIPRAPHATIFAPTTEGRGCAGALIEQFTIDPRSTLDTSCVDHIAEIDWDTLPGTYATALFGVADFWDGAP